MSFKPKYGMHEQMKKSKPDEALVIKLLKKIPYFKSIEGKGEKEDLADAFLIKKNEWLEIKIDYTSYPNHFIEKYSKLEDKTPGGPWQYQKRGVKWYVFYYKMTKELYIFKTKDLIDSVEELFESSILSAEKQGRKVFQNHGQYTTFGYIVPKKLLDKINYFK